MNNHERLGAWGEHSPQTVSGQSLGAYGTPPNAWTTGADPDAGKVTIYGPRDVMNLTPDEARAMAGILQRMAAIAETYPT